jgi:hypothetical protein
MTMKKILVMALVPLALAMGQLCAKEKPIYGLAVLDSVNGLPEVQTGTVALTKYTVSDNLAFNSVTHKFTVKKTGRYSVEAFYKAIIDFTTPPEAGNVFQLQISVNGAKGLDFLLPFPYTLSTEDVFARWARYRTLLHLNEGDTVSLDVLALPVDTSCQFSQNPHDRVAYLLVKKI